MTTIILTIKMRGTSHINCSLRGLRNVVTLKFTSKKGRPPSAFLLSSPLYQSPPLLQRLQPEEQNRGEEREKAVRGCCSLFGLIIHTAALALSLLIPPSFVEAASLDRRAASPAPPPSGVTTTSNSAWGKRRRSPRGRCGRQQPACCCCFSPCEVASFQI